MRTSAFFGEKSFGFFEIFGVSHGQGGRSVELVRTIFGQAERGSIFHDFVRMSFMDDPLMKICLCSYSWCSCT